MLSIGDGHARQGEGEVCGTAVEAAMNTVVVVDLLKGHAPASPRIESDDFVMTTGSARPLEDAFRMSQLDLVGWTGSLLGLDELDAYQLVSQVGLAPAGNVVDTNYTMVAEAAEERARLCDGVRRAPRPTSGDRSRLPQHPLRACAARREPS